MLQYATPPKMPEDWSLAENETIVSDYFQMFNLEIGRTAYSKAQHKRALLVLLKNRNAGSIDYKYRNISAVLAGIGLPYINGFKPAANIQRKILPEVVRDYIRKHPVLEKSFEAFSDKLQPINLPQTFHNFEQKPPKRKPVINDHEGIFRNPVKINYIEREQSNKVIGDSGEKLVLEYERWRLIYEGKESLADKVERVSETKGDGLGFDILSKNINGSDRFIEVKATTLTKEAPFYFSQNELAFSKTNASNYYLYRVFNLRNDAKLFILNGSFDEFCNYKPFNYKGFF